MPVDVLIRPGHEHPMERSKMTQLNEAAVSPDTGRNPLFEEFTGPFRVPPFGAIEPAHFSPAFDHAFAAHDAEIAAIAADPAEPTFDNTIVALELAGRELSRVADVFGLLT